ncbi:hypothetical protein K1W54_05505 [Micromonospora sp. CPCC 205371]|nr:hypothetical protein [Micromonospora sp. CPCC 205371]
MAGTVHALLLKRSVQSRAQVALPVVPLAPETGLVLLPLTDEIVASITKTAVHDPAVAGFYDLTSGVAQWASRHSVHGLVAYLHTEFFGGSGFHAAVAWRDGVVAWGPVFTATSSGQAPEHYAVVADRRDMAVNVLLRWLGVRRANQIDEFAAAGLSRCRWTEEWAALTFQ